MSKLKALLLTEGLHGMISQTEGLAKALNFDYIHEKIELNSFWKLIPTSFTPVKKFVFKNKIEQDAWQRTYRSSKHPLLFFPFLPNVLFHLEPDRSVLSLSIYVLHLEGQDSHGNVTH